MTAVDHALIDGVSVLLMFRDLSAAYAGDLGLTQTRFSQYVGYVQQQDKSASMDFWKEYLQDVSPCHFPVLNDDSHASNELHELTASVDRSLNLHDFCKKHSKEWVATYPNDVIGFAMGNFMNLSTAIALYALVSKELSGNDGLTFPGSPAFYTKFDSFTSSKLHAEFCNWAALEPRAANQAFNVVNGDVESWQNLWPKVVEYFGGSVKRNQFEGAHSSDGDMWSTMDMAPEPPISVVANEIGIQKTPVLRKSVVEQQIDLVKWSQRADVKSAWESFAERKGLDKEIFDKATWAFLGFVLGRSFDLVMPKA